MAFPVIEDSLSNRASAHTDTTHFALVSGIQSGEVIVVAIQRHSTTVAQIASVPSGWTEINASSTTGQLSAVYAKISDGTETSFDLEFSIGATRRTTWISMRISGGTLTGYGMDYAVATSSTGDNMPTVSLSDDALVLWCVGANTGVDQEAILTMPSTLVQRDSTVAGANNSTLGVSYENHASGTSTAAAWSSSVAYSWSQTTFAIYSDAGGGGSAVHPYVSITVTG